MGSAGSVELQQQPSQIICTPARTAENNSNGNNASSATPPPTGTPTPSVKRQLPMNDVGNTDRSANHIEYIGTWEYKLSTENNDDASTWIPFSSSDQERLEESFAKMKSEAVMAMVGRTAWNVHLAASNKNSSLHQSFQMTRGSGHGGIARRSRVEKPDAHAPSSFDEHNKTDDLSSSDFEGNFPSGGGGDGGKNLNEIQDAANEGSRAFAVSLHSTIKAHQALVYCIDFSRDGRKVLSGSRDGTFRYWEIGSSQALCDYQPITDGVILSCAISPNGKFAACGSSNSYAYLWSTERKADRAVGESGQFQRPLSALTGHTHKVYGAKFTSDSRTLVTGAMDNTVRTWDVGRECPIRSITPHTAAVFTIAASASNPNLVLSGADDHLLISHDLRTPSDKGVGAFKGHKATIWASDIRFDNNQFVSAGMDGACLLWDPRNPSRPLLHVGDHGIYPVHCAEFMPEGTHVMTSARDSTWRLWDVRTAGEDGNESENNEPDSRTSVEKSNHNDNHKTSLSAYNPIRNSPCCNEVCRVTAHRGNVFKIAYEPLRNLVMTCGSDGLIKVFNLKQRF